MDLKKAKTIFNSLYEEVDGYKISFEGRSKLNCYDQSLTYGEIYFDTFYEIINKLSQKKKKYFRI